MNNTSTEKRKNPIIIPTTEASHLTWVEIDANAFNHNIAQYKNIVHPALLAVVIKSNAYGHGMHHIAALAEENRNVDYLCTVSLSEAISLRVNGIKKPILVLSILDDDLEKACIYNVDLVLYDMHTAHLLNRIGISRNQTRNVHIKVDTGLSRLGIAAHHAFDFIQELKKLPHLTVQGIFTHFAESEKSDQTFTNQQIKNFEKLIETVEKAEISIPLKHTSCSAAITANSNSHFTMARVGIGAYGLWPSEDNKKVTQTQHIYFSLKPVLQWKTKIILIKEVPAGSFVGYDRTHCVHHTTRIATLPVGYWDGYDRKLSNNSYVIINNTLARVVGRIAMNLMMVDVTNVDAHVGDKVILLGNHATITADALAARCDTINYEFVTRINPMIPRVVL